jgi:hypothetical protein
VIDADDLTVEVRDPGLVRRGQLDHRDITDLTLAPVWNGVGTWKVTLPRGPLTDMLRTPGWGLLVTYGDRTFSGPTLTAKRARSATDPAGSWELAGVDDNVHLADRRAYPSPSTDVLTAQAGTDGSGYDVRAGAAETVMKALVRANLGDLAPLSRQLAGGMLDVEPDLGRGAAVRLSLRFDKLGEALALAATTGGGLGFNLRHVVLNEGPGRYLFEVYQPRDLSGTVRLDVDADNVDDASYGYGAPEITAPIVLGQGEAAARQIVTATTPETDAAAALWDRRIEDVIDQRQTSDLGELAQAALEALADKGTTATSMTFTLRAGSSKRFGFDYWLGDRVSIVPDDPVMFPNPDDPAQGGEFSDVLTAGSITFTKDGLRTFGVVGNVQTTSRNLLLQMLRVQSAQGRRIGRIERS